MLLGLSLFFLIFLMKRRIEQSNCMEKAKTAIIIPFCVCVCSEMFLGGFGKIIRLVYVIYERGSILTSVLIRLCLNKRVIIHVFPALLVLKLQ